MIHSKRTEKATSASCSNHLGKECQLCTTLHLTNQNSNHPDENTLHGMIQEIVALIIQKPEKAAVILQEWIRRQR